MDKQIRVYDIDWDSDGEDVNLPDEVLVTEPTQEMLEDTCYADAISDYLSDEYDFCVNGFRMEVM